MSINVFTFSGRIGRDAEIRNTGSGKSVTGFPVAVDVGYGDNKQTMWVDCSMWGERGEKLAAYLPKGAAVTVTGEASLQTYISSGVEKTKLSCRVNGVQLPPRSAQGDQQRAEPARSESARQQAPQRQQPQPVSDFDDDDIPF